MLKILRASLTSRKRSSTRENHSVAKDLSVMIFGSGTGVGKTMVSTGICRSGLSHGRKVCYIKPVQTGELDEYFVQLYANPQGISDIFVRTMHHWSPAMSPHLAARLDPTAGRREGGGMNEEVVTDRELVRGLQHEMAAFATAMGEENSRLFTVVETAGGVLSPGPSSTLQADIYRPLRLPIILVGDSKLGGITTTLSSFESLRLRGYTVHAIVLIEHAGQAKYNNYKMIEEHLQRSFSAGTATLGNEAWTANATPRVFVMKPLPAEGLLHSWFRENDAAFADLVEYVGDSVAAESQRLIEMRRRGQQTVWWPFTQHAAVTPNDVSFIESAHGDLFKIIRPANTSDGLSAGTGSGGFGISGGQESWVSHSKYQYGNTGGDKLGGGGVPTRGAVQENDFVITDLFDGCASWWTQGVGHGNPSMALALAEAAGRYGHVMFPSNLHPPAVQLASYLLEGGPGKGWASRVFYSDDGSTGMEIAIKMALRLWESRALGSQAEKDLVSGDKKEKADIIIIAQKDCYHGDTLGTMDVAEENAFNMHQHPWYRPRAACIPTPRIFFRKGRLNIDGSELGLGGEKVQAAIGSSGPWATIKTLLDVEARKGSDLENAYRGYVNTFLDKTAAASSETEEAAAQLGALLIEPLMLGAGGLRFVDPLFQRVLVQECKARKIPVVFDEVAVGMYRLGPSTTSSILQETPDIGVYGKMLSGGYLPLAATLATAEVFNAFLGNKKWHALLHGHSYTANPIACAAAIESVRIIEGVGNAAGIRGKSSSFDPQLYGGCGGVPPSFTELELSEVSQLPGVHSAMSLGSVLSVELAMGTPFPVAPPAAITSAITEKVGERANRAIKDNGNEQPAQEQEQETTHTTSIFKAGTFTASVRNSIVTPGPDIPHQHHPNPLGQIEATAAAAAAGAAAGAASTAAVLTGVPSTAAVTSATSSAYSYNSNVASKVVSLLKQDGIYARPLGNVVYLMASPLTSEAGRQRLVRVLKRCITKAFYVRNTLHSAGGASGSAGAKVEPGAGAATIV